MENKQAQIAEANLPRFREELDALLLEYRRLAHLKTDPGCPEELREALVARMRQVEAQIWTAERSIEFLEREAASGAQAQGDGDHNGDGPA